jgi:hypothetical protein
MKSSLNNPTHKTIWEDKVIFDGYMNTKKIVKSNFQFSGRRQDFSKPMPKLLLIIHINLFLTIWTQSLWAGAWTQKKGQFYSKISLLRFESSSQYLLNGDRERLADNGKVVDLGFYYYLEYGLYDNLTFITSAPFKTLNFSCATTGCDHTTTGLGDIYGAFRYRLSQKNWVVSVQAGIKIAPGYQTDEEQLNSAPPLGDGQTDVDFHLLIGRSIFNYHGYITMDFGYRARSGEPVDEIPFAMELGANLTKNYLLIGQLYGVRSISGKQGQPDFRVIDGVAVNFVGTGAVEDFLKGQVQLVYKINPWLDLSFVFEQVLAGRNTSRASILGGGIAVHK